MMSNPQKTQSSIKTPPKKDRTSITSSAKESKPVFILNRFVVIASLLSVVIGGYSVNLIKERQLQSFQESWKTEYLKVKTELEVSRKIASQVQAGPDHKALCESGSGKDCYALFEASLRYEEQMDKLLKHLEKSCELKFANACYVLGLIYKNENVALGYASKACEYKSQRGCGSAQGLEVHRGNFAGGFKYAVIQCEEFNSAFSCYSAGLIKIEMRQREEAIHWLQKACNINEQKACEELPIAKQLLEIHGT